MIRFEAVTKTYSDGTAAVADFSLTIASHAFVVLLGSSGCGKTTLLRMINRMVDPTAGSVWIDDDNVAELDPVQLRRRIGYVMQAGGLLPHLKVADNVATVPLLTGASKREARKRAAELLDLVGLPSKVADRYPSQLSGGQRQRVGVARALAADPNILLMDEPFGAVDPVVRTELQGELLRIQSELAKTIVFVTHDVAEAFTLGDEVLVLREGAEIAQQGTPERIMLEPADDFVAQFIGGDRRLLHVGSQDGQQVVFDAAGQITGVLDQS